MFEEKLALYDRLVAANPNFERKGKTMAFTSANGYMFSQLNKAGELGIRLSKEACKAFIAQHGGGAFTSYGATMRDYVLVPDTLLQDLETVGRYLQQSYEHVMSLPPK